VLGCVGLSWATFCGDFAARHVHAEKETGDEKYYSYFNADRKFLIPLRLQRNIGERLAFLLNKPLGEVLAEGFQRGRAGALADIECGELGIGFFEWDRLGRGLEPVGTDLSDGAELPCLDGTVGRPDHVQKDVARVGTV